MVSPIANESAMRVAKVRNRRPEDAKSLAPAKAEDENEAAGPASHAAVGSWWMPMVRPEASPT
jgi:hypothetical protein